MPRFRWEWKSDPRFKDWIDNCSNPSKAYCRPCMDIMPAELSYLTRHNQERLHMEAMARRQRGHSRGSSLVRRIKSHEATLALYFCEHGSLSASDHLIAALKKFFTQDRSCQRIRFDRTKYSEIIKNSWSACFRNDLKMDIGESEYSLLLGESSENEDVKILSTVIMYFSKKQKKIISTFLFVMKFSNWSSESNVKSLNDQLEKFGLDINKLIGFGTATENTNSLAKRFKRFYETKRENRTRELVLRNCVWQTAYQDIIDTLSHCFSRNIKFIIYETFNWFLRTPARKQKYKNFFKEIYDDREPAGMKFMSDYECSLFDVAVRKVLNNWEDLKMHFEATRNLERCYIAEMLYNNYQDPINLFYFRFLDLILESEISRFCDGYVGDRYKNPIEYLNILKMNISANIYRDHDSLFQRNLQSHQREYSLTSGQLEEIQRKCGSFCDELLHRLRKRSTKDDEFLKKLQNFTAKRYEIIHYIEQFGYSGAEKTKILDQYERLKHADIQNDSNSISFWLEVLNKGSRSTRNFQDVAKFAIKILCMPRSKPEIGKIFKNIQIKISEFKDFEMMDATLTVQYGLKRQGKCCCDYNASLELFSNDNYSNYNGDSEMELD